ncbi:MAG: type II secretion system F family protein [Alphaproteobacteria bacterium]
MGGFFDAILDPDTMLLILASLGAAISVLAVGLPLVQRDQRRNRMQSVVSYRDELKTSRKHQVLGRHEKKQADAASSIGDFFKLQRMGKSDFRQQLMAAGFRKPSHAVTFMIARLVAPFVLAALAFTLMQILPKPLPKAVVALTTVFMGMFGFFLPAIYVKNQMLKRLEEVRLRFPDALDLLLVCVEGGQGIEASVATVTNDIGRSSPTLGEEFGLLGAELSFLGERAQALRNLSTRVPEPGVKSFTTAMIQAEKYGTPLAQALRVLSSEMRDMRFAEAEKRAAALPPKLTVPMIVFFMPTLFVVILGPAILQAIDSASQM